MIDISTLPMNSTLIAPPYLHPLLRSEFLEHKQGVLGVTLCSLTSFLLQNQFGEIPSIHTILFQYRNILIQHQSSLSIYKEVSLAPTFLKDCYQYIEDMKEWHITIDNLPEENDAQVEIKFIIHHLFNIITPNDHKQKALHELQQKDASHVYIYDTYTTLEESNIIELLCKNNAKLLQVPQQVAQKNFFHATNKRQEVESCAQYIIQKAIDTKDIHITLADSTYAPLLQQVFNRYQIPFTSLSQTLVSIITKRIIALLNYYVYKDTTSLMEAIDTGAFPFQDISYMQSYLNVFPKNIHAPFEHLQKDLDTGHVLQEYDIIQLTKLEEKAETVRSSYIQQFNLIEQATSYESLFLEVFKLIETTLITPADAIIFTNIQSIIKEIFPYIQNDEDILFALSFMEDGIQQSSVQEIGGALVTSLTQCSTYRQTHFIMGCTQKNYPAFPSKSGVFDEDYYALLPYPKMEDRYAFHIHQLDKILHSSESCIASFPLGTYEGKPLEAAIEIEQFMVKKAVSYPLQNSYQELRVDTTITPAMASRLFIKNGKVHGSISSLERYVKCPFSYFLRYGLSLQEPMEYGFSDSYMGSISHYVLEVLNQELGKSYTKATADKVNKILTSEVDIITKVFPNLEAQLKSIQHRMHSSILQTLKRLHEFEQHSHLYPWKQEEEFYYDVNLRDDVVLSLHGFIDRIDADANFACILDYKSSSKKLSEPNVFAALQLQLLTYSIVSEKLDNKTILGAYYISLKNENNVQIAGKVSRRKPVTFQSISSKEQREAIQKAHRFNGWTMNPNIDLLDDDGSHITGVHQNKDGIVTASKTYDLSTIHQYFTSMYQQIGERILHGDNAIEPSDDACTYCKYHEICRFSGFFSVKEPLIKPDDSLYLKGGEEDA